ncbi:TIGR03364 family FAD-dependent oxidoreductase [Limobrevibacterium gyesilva]|uniref:TIGR03364 family FAD-dependent oxidoreductase n=1 Tax=Limobrevibacterium gyesilva TaxID=2991712 RepID=A0AA41YSK1_9PROT|nr:TIGR03364 family FAD-dependent oxidoreductase [Limobrevibacterium gyesilva]MCW3475808.1 TIGR03364 family FAD-dependent oxidoreductase [Limobrevibacterium gyesilva]
MHRNLQFDCVIVGHGIVGLAHALAASRHGLRTAVIDRDARAAGASVRNFGFVTVTGQEQGITWRRAMRSRDVWAEVAEPAGIAVHQRGLLMCARRPEAMTVLEAFAASDMGRDCRILRGDALVQAAPMLAGELQGALHSPHELRVESRHAVPQLAAWLAAAHGVTFLPRMAALAVEPGRVVTPGGVLTADHVVVCPGTDLVTLFPEITRRRGITLCKLHMLRLADPGWRLPAAVMSDLGLVRYLGYGVAPSLPALRARLEAEQAAWLADGIHLIVVQDADGTMVVGDSHHYADTPDPFQPRAVDDRILAELELVLGRPAPEVIERWTGVYPSGPDVAFTEAPMDGVRLVMVTSGTGASTAFAIAEETMADLLGLAPPPHAA